MKTETQIVEENIKENHSITGGVACEEHKASCQRFLEFLEKCYGKEGCYLPKNFNISSLTKDIKDKIQDLKQAIKEYNKNGI